MSKYAGRTALLVGSSACLWDDIDAFEKIAASQGWEWDVAAVNHAGLAINHPVEHWVSCHPPLIHYLKKARDCYTHNTLGENGPMITHGPAIIVGSELMDRQHSVRHDIIINSAVFGIYVMFLLKYERVVLAGIPFDGNRTYYHPKQVKPEFSDDIRHIRNVWERVMDAEEWEGRVFSMSGWTRALLGDFTDLPG